MTVDIRTASRLAAVASYCLACAIGVASVLATFPHWAIVGGLPPGAPPVPDFAKDIIGQLYFFSQAWRLDHLASLLTDSRLNSPWGASIAFTDSIPAVAIVAKLLKPLLPPFDQAITIYQMAAWILQPVATVFALRGAGEKRIAPAIAASVMAISMPTWLYRFWHAALTGHCFLILMLGLYFRIVRQNKPSLVCACLLQILLLLIHPYLMLMGTAILFAAPLSQAINRQRAWRKTALACAASSGTVMLLGQALGYWGAESDGGFGYYSMNILGPVWPTFSTLFPAIPFAAADATGGQAEGYQYLGAGLIALLLLSCLGWRQWGKSIRSHLGLATACAGLTGLALSNWVYFLHARIIHVPFPSMLLAQVRASGRLFWPVAYAGLIGSIVVLGRRLPKTGVILVALAAIMQFADARFLRQLDGETLTSAAPYPFDQPRLSAILRQHQRLTLLPTFPCNGGGIPLNEDVVWLAAQSRMEINSIYSAREDHARACLPVEAAYRSPAAGELVVFVPPFAQASALLPSQNDDCRLLSPLLLCTQRHELLAGLPRYSVRQVPVSVDLPVSAGSLGADSLLAGWATPLPSQGVWSVSQTALLGGFLSSLPHGAIKVRISAAAIPSPDRLGFSSKMRIVSVWSKGEKIAEWVMKPSQPIYEATIPARLIKPGAPVVIELKTGPLASQLDLGKAMDPRRFGIFLRSIRFIPVS